MTPQRRRRAATRPSLRPAAAAEAAAAPADELWRAYRAELLGFARKRVGDGAAEDVVHDVLHRAYSARHALRDPRRLRSWLYQIARNAVVDHFRATRPTQPVPDDLAAPAPGQDRAAERELAGCLRPLLAALPAGYREAVTLAELEGLTQQEAADRLGLSLSGAKSRVQRGRQRLAAALLACCRIELDRRGGVVRYDCRDGRHCRSGAPSRSTARGPAPGRCE